MADLIWLVGVSIYYELKFTETPVVVQGYVHVDKTINRIKKGERVGIHLDPAT